MKLPLTDKELEVLVCMRDFFRANDMLPPVITITQTLGMSSSTVITRQEKLEAKGYIERNAVGKFRFVREEVAA